MKKVGIIAASVALILAGCNGDSNLNKTSPLPSSKSNNIIITAMDGYFKNAVIFNDKNNDGKWQSSEFLGLTDEFGKVEISSDFSGVLGVQTLTPDGAASIQLAKLDPTKYAGVYTIDMDRPSQPVAHEVIFFAPAKSTVISPITDLIIINVTDVNDDEMLLLAEKTVKTQLGLTSKEMLYKDFVSGGDANIELHKIAQILAETKVATPTYKDDITEIIAEAVKVVKSIAGTDKLTDPDYRPVVDGNTDTIPKENVLIKVNEDAYRFLQDQLDNAGLTTDSTDISLTYSLQNIEVRGKDGQDMFVPLFHDGDRTDQSSVKLSIVEGNHDGDNKSPQVHQLENGLLLKLYPDTNTLSLTGDVINKLGGEEFKIYAEDVSSTGDKMGQAIASFELKVARSSDDIDNKPPVVSDTVSRALQATVEAQWQLVKGTHFEQTLPLDGLFSDPENDTLILRADTSMSIDNGMTAEIVDDYVVVKGTPLKAASEDSITNKLYLFAKDIVGQELFVIIDLPDVQEPQGDTLIPTVSISSTSTSFAALKSDGSVVTWGSSNYGGDSSSVQNELVDIIKIHSSREAFAALKEDGTVITWGSSIYGGDSSSVQNELVDVKEIYSSEKAFAALKSNGSVITWGDSSNGGDSSSVESELADVKSIFSNNAAFAALRANGTVVTWGWEFGGGDSSSAKDELVNVKRITGSNEAFAALKNDGTVVTWGYPLSGSNSSSVKNELIDVREVFSTETTFAALRNDGTVVTWGNGAGADSSSVKSYLITVKDITSNWAAYAALKNDGTVVTWGQEDFGGVTTLIQDDLTDIKEIFSTSAAFAALKNDGTVVSWGHNGYGGDSSLVQSELVNVKKIVSNVGSFAALKTDGTVVSWGSDGDAKYVQDNLTNVKEIFCTDKAFAALKNDGSVITWGWRYDGGDSSSVEDELRH
ncbi:RCC1 domain-containing protein [Photobacterium lipolyticum]|uniref:Uncharacterized protein n=1 Tax=Photobacterium lipolyticum TaxID=266810 RepID=A0A2T3MZQ3_9GAMM|nr:hypothetical protein [Photobacterium lipolyticum]PSW05460.1 hypothetical protein C9I89_09430 [Photobacterium lipolyticum]